MPSKSKRRASRQAQLSGRRRRRGGRPRGDATAQPQVQEVRRQARPTVATAVAPRPEASAPVQTQQAAPSPTSSPRRRSSRPRAPVEPLQMYPYLGSELRRIGALTSLVAITLAVLTVVLR